MRQNMGWGWQRNCNNIIGNDLRHCQPYSFSWGRNILVAIGLRQCAVCVCWGGELEEIERELGMVLCVPNPCQPSARETGLWTWVRLCCRSHLRVELHDLVCKGWEKGGCRKREVLEPGMNTLPCLLDCAISSEGLGCSPTYVIKGSKAPCCTLKGQWWSQLMYRFYTQG